MRRRRATNIPTFVESKSSASQWIVGICVRVNRKTAEEKPTNDLKRKWRQTQEITRTNHICTTTHTDWADAGSSQQKKRPTGKKRERLSKWNRCIGKLRVERNRSRPHRVKWLWFGIPFYSQSESFRVCLNFSKSNVTSTERVFPFQTDKQKLVINLNCLAECSQNLNTIKQR